MTKTKKTMTIICQIFVFLLIIVVLACGTTKFSLLNKQRYYDNIFTEEFDAVVLKTAEDSLEINQSIIAFPSEVLFAGLNKDVFLEDCHNFTKSAINALFTGEAVQTYNSEHTEFYDTIDELFEKYEKKSGLSTSEEDKETVVNLLSGNINAQVNYLPVMVTSTFSTMGNSIAYYGKAVSDLFWPALILLLAFLAVIIVLNKDNFTRALYKFAIPGWFACSVLFIPTLIFCSYNLADRLPLKTSGMASFVQGLVKTVQNAIFSWTVAAFVTSFCLLIVSIISYALVKHRRTLRTNKY